MNGRFSTANGLLDENGIGGVRMVRAIWQGIYHDLRDNIVDGTYPLRSLLPSEAALVQLYDCSHNTLRKALAALAEEGLVQPIHGKGVRVIYRPRERAIFEVGGIETFSESMERLDMAPTTRIALFEHVKADTELAAMTGFEKGAPLVHIERVRSIGDEAVILDVNYFLETVIPGLTPQIAERSIYTYLENNLGVKVALAQRSITVERATARDRELLDLDDDTHLAVVTSLSFTAGGDAFEYTQSRHRPDMFAFHNTARRRS